MLNTKNLAFTLSMTSLGMGLCTLAGCPSTDREEVSASEVAASTVSGALNNTESQAALGLGPLPRERRTTAGRIWDALTPIRPAFAASWTCSGASLDHAYVGATGNPYLYTPVSCSVQWGLNKTASAVWNSTFILNYGAACDPTTPFMDNQPAGCTLTRTTSTDGNTRTLTGPRGNFYSITHNTYGAGTGWDPSVAPAPSNDGVTLACGSSGCAVGRSLTIAGSHLSGTIDGVRFWDHTVSTAGSGITVAGAGPGRVVTGTVFVQHNLAHVTSTTTFNDVAYTDGACCYPTSGSLTTTFSKGPDQSRTETLTFGAVCGDATLTRANGRVASITLDQCL
jgi:hypothetical protein